ncbi:hypothetical protein [Prochlorococcus sp. MIT 1303]|uniref:hypothetical protein n=1 Tax=Prochlorococcus sp. MIT 1303 TaxID=1723647 RepID=UPI0007BB34F4|nr:hypothetical protein [Prochlorococcus sp. MIT 1303]KZR66853.1 hypothetical protein PMIT1303_00810 [Prochlorococcus sp. MIT 1303]
MESLAYSCIFFISKHDLLLINMTHIDESKATGCSTEAEMAPLVEADLCELFISSFNWAGNSTAFPLSK